MKLGKLEPGDKFILLSDIQDASKAIFVFEKQIDDTESCTFPLKPSTPIQLKGHRASGIRNNELEVVKLDL